MTITAVNNKDNTTNLCGLIGLIYEDYLSIYYAIKYLNNSLNLNLKLFTLTSVNLKEKL